MTESIASRPSIVQGSAVPEDRFTGLPQRPELSVEMPKEFIIEDELLGGVFSPDFSSDVSSAEKLIGLVHSFDQERDIIKPFLRWMIAGRVNNPYLILANSDRPIGREADTLGTDQIKDPETGMEDPKRAVRIKAMEGAYFIRSVKASPGGDAKIERMFQILRQGKISTPSQYQQRIEDLRILRELDSALGLSRMMFQSARSEGEEKNYRVIENASEVGKRFREGTSGIVDDLVKKEAKDPEKPLIDYEVIDEGDGLNRKIRVIRRVRLPQNLKSPRPGFERKRIDLELAKEGLSSEERDGYEILALAAHYLTDPLIRTAIESSYKLEIPKIKTENLDHSNPRKAKVRVVVDGLKKAFLLDIE